MPMSFYINLMSVCLCLTSLVAQMIKRLSTTRETRVWSLGREDSLEKEIAIHSSTIAWKIPWTEEPGRLQSMGSLRVGHDWATSWLHYLCLQKSCKDSTWKHFENIGQFWENWSVIHVESFLHPLSILILILLAYCNFYIQSCLFLF